MPGQGSSETVQVKFYPQEWVDKEGLDTYAAPAEDHEPVEFEVPLSDATDEDGKVYPTDTDQSDQLREHKNAPKWVREYEGPFYVATS